MRPLLLSIALSFGADAASTHYGLTHGAHEVVLTQNPWVNDAIIGGEAVVVALGLRRLHRTHPKLAMALGWGIVGSRATVAAYNLHVSR